MSGRSDPVEDDTGDPSCGVERGKAVQQCGNAVTLAAGIDHQDHRGAKQSSDVRGGPRCGRAPGRPNAPVEQPQHPFDHGDVRARNSMRVQGADKPLPHQYRVEIAAGPSRGQGVIAGVDKIRAYLKRRDGVTGLPQRSDQARRDRGLTAADAGAATATADTRITTRCPSAPCGPHPSGASPWSSRSPDRRPQPTAGVRLAR